MLLAKAWVRTNSMGAHHRSDRPLFDRQYEEPEDFATRAAAFAQLIPLGVVSSAQAARLLHLPVRD
jgi:hypothetical protein